MKEFIKNNKVTYNLMSFTAFKALLIFSMLLDGPKSYQEFIEYFQTHDYLNEKISIDTVRVYINSLKKSGCEIIKTKRSEGSKFVLLSHPFELNVTSEQVKVISKVYKMISKTVDITELILLEKLLRKISNNIMNEQLTVLLTKFSPLSGIKIELLEELLNSCKHNLQIVLKYKSPRSGNKRMEIVCDRLGFDSGKLYLYGTSVDFCQSVYLPVVRIINVSEVKFKRTENLTVQNMRVTYKIKSRLKELQLNDYENIISNDDSSITVEAISSNKFMLIQRILSFGSACTVLAPSDFRSELVDTLKKMRAEY